MTLREVAAMLIPHELPDEFPNETVLVARLAKTNYLF